MTIRVLLISDIRLYRESLAQALRCVDDLCLLGSVASWLQIGEHLIARGPDVVLLDMAATQPFDGMGNAQARLPSARIVALTVPEDEADLIDLAETGIAGFVTRQGSLGDIIVCIEAAAKGELHCSAAAAGSLMRRLADLSTGRTGGRLIEGLTPREQHILDLVEQGLSNKQIARAATIEVATVKNHIHNILEKLGVQRRGEAAAVLRRATPQRHFVIAEGLIAE